MRVAAYQFDVRREDVATNLAAARRGVEEAARAGVRLVVLPEMWPTSFPSSAEHAPALVQPSLEAVEELARFAGTLGVAVGGSAFAESSFERPFNRLHLLVDGVDLLGYDKLHLFSPTGEGLAFRGGESLPRVVEWSGVRIGGAICYDLRFARVTEALAGGLADLVIVPAQWPIPRIAHWRALLGGRAVETQAFYLGANRVGEEPLGRRRTLEFSGGSSLVGPDGVVRAELTGESGLVIGDVDVAEVARMRRAVPVRRDRRTDV